MKLWGGRFETGPSEVFERFSNSLHFDRRLLAADVRGSQAFARSLTRAGVLTEAECARLCAAFDGIQADAAEETFFADAHDEDVHSFVIHKLKERVGALADKIHTGRSRNEQVSLDTRIWLRGECDRTRELVRGLLSALLDLAEKYPDAVIPGYTHLRRAQPVLWPHYLLAYFEMFLRDYERLGEARRRANVMPLGSGALAGSGFPHDREAIARDLEFDSITRNSMDVSGDRDFALDYLYALAVIATHLSRLAEDFVLFASQEFSFIVLPDEFSTGSSLMPQKKNPDAWELLRGKTGRVTASLHTLLTTMKGLPSSYQRDLQEDKEPVFAAHDQAYAMLTIAAGAVAATRPNEARMREAAADPALLATEAAHYLVRRGAPFRQAHEIVGQIVREGERAGKSFSTLPLETLQKFSPLFAPDYYDTLKLDSALAGPDVEGGTAPARVRDAIAAAKLRLAALEKKS
jgi:argininosuccinate lyase